MSDALKVKDKHCPRLVVFCGMQVVNEKCFAKMTFAVSQCKVNTMKLPNKWEDF